MEIDFYDNFKFKLYPILLTENLQSMFTLNLCPVVFVKNNLPYTSH